MKPKFQSLRSSFLFPATICAVLASTITAKAASFTWNTTTGTWDTSSSNWTGGGSTWVDGSGNSALFSNTATASTITLNGDRTAGTVTIGNASNNYNYTFTSSSASTLSATSLVFQGSSANGSNDTSTSNTKFNGSLNLNTNNGNVTIGRGALEFGGTGTFNLGTGSITRNADWGVFIMSGSANVSAASLNMSGGGTSTGRFELNGGTLTTGSITGIDTGSGFTTHNRINGTTIKATGNNANFLTIVNSTVVAGSGNILLLGNSGATFDTNGFSIGTATAFQNSSGAAGTLTKSGSGTLTLSGSSTFTGNVTINSGTLAVGTGIAGNTASSIASNLGDFGSGVSRSITINNGGNLTFTGGNVFGYSNATLSGVTLVVNQGGVFQTGPSSGTGYFSKIGAVNLNGGTISVGNGDSGYGGALALLGTVTVGGSTSSTIGTLSGASTYDVVNIGQSDPGISAVTFNVADVTGDSGVDLTVSAGLADRAHVAAASSITKTGVGTMVLSGANTYTGTTTISAGTLSAASLANGGSASSIGKSTNAAGNLVFDGGALEYTGATVSSDRAFTINAGKTATIQVDSSGANLTLAGATGTTTSGALVKSGAGTLTLTGASTYSGATTVSAGTLLLSGTSAINSSSGITINGSGAKFLLTSSVTSTPAITLTQGTLDGTGTVGAVTVGNGTGGILTNGNGSTTALTFGSLTFSGAGTMNVNTTGSAAFAVTGLLSTTGAGNITINSNGTGGSWSAGTYNLITFGSQTGSTSANSFALGTLTGYGARFSGALGQTGSAITLTLTGDTPKWTGLDNSGGSANWVVGSTGPNGNWKLITAGTATDYISGDIALFDDSAAGVTAVNISGADVNPATTTFNNSTKDYTLGSTGGFKIAGGSLSKSGTGSLTISTANTYTGGTNVNGGTLVLSGSGTLGATTGAVAMGGGKIDLGTTSQTVGAVTITAAAASGNTIQNGSLTASSVTASNASGNATVSANLLGSGTVTKSGAGTLTLTGANTYSGGTSVKNGTLVLGTGGSLASSNTITLGDTSNTSGIFQLGDSSGAVNTSATSLTTAGSGTANAVVGGNAAVSTLTINSSGSVSYGGLLGGAGTNQNNVALTKTGAGTLTLSGVNTYTGGSTVNGGTLAGNGSSAFGSGAVQVNSGAVTVNLNAETMGTNFTNATGTSATINNTSGNTTLSGSFTGSGATLTTAGGAAAGVAANTTFTGVMTLGSLVSQGNSGNNQTSAPQSGGIYTAEQSTTFNNATLSVSGNVLVGRSSLVFTGSTVATITGNISNATGGGLTNNDWASVVISGSANVTAASLNLGSAVTGQFYLNGGTLTVGSIAAMDSTDSGYPVHNVFNGTQIIASGDNASFLTITKANYWAGSNEVFVGNSGALFNSNGHNIGTSTVFQNDTGATGFLTKSGSGTLTLSGASTYTGGTTVNAGTLDVTGTLADTGAVNVNGGTYKVSHDDTVGAVTLTSGTISNASGKVLTGSSYAVQSGTVSGILGGSGALTKSTSGTVTLSGANTYTGATNVNAGTLALSGSGSVANSSVIKVASGATLDASAVTGGNWTVGSSQRLTGSGGVTGATTIAGTHNVGDAAVNSGVGSQAFSSSLSYASNSIFEWDLNANSTGSGFDTVSAAGPISVDTTGTVFKVILGSGVDMTNAFWSTPAIVETWSMASIFGQSFSSGAFQTVETSTDVSTYGHFTISGSSLTWTAVPEPTSALAGLLLGAGLLRRRRGA